MASDPTRPDPPPIRRDGNAGNVDPLGAIERRIVKEMGAALDRLSQRMSAAEAYEAARDAGPPQRPSARERAAALWKLN
jgi:hypothetical protein